MPTEVDTRAGRPPRKDADGTGPMPVLRAVAGSPDTAYLIHIFPPGPAVGSRFIVGEQPAVIGRDTSCPIHCADRTVSRRHAELKKLPDGRFQVTDLGSANGTRVNDARVKTAVLADGDYLRLGDNVFRFLVGSNVEADYHKEIHRLAVLDPLTGVYNRRALTDYLDRETARAVRHRRPLALLLIDIDRFKAVNDDYGHPTGDAVLRCLAAVVKSVLPADGLVGRYGGEEFAVLLPESSGEAVGEVAERLRRAVELHPFEYDGRRLAVTVSVGIGSVVPGERLIVGDLVKRADDRLYEAKEAGRNRVCPSAACPESVTEVDHNTPVSSRRVPR